MLRKYIPILVAIACIALGTAWTRTVQALTVTPLILELSGNPGQTVQSSFTLINDERVEKTYFIRFRNFESKDESGEPEFTDDTSGLANWITAEKSIVLEPLGRKDVTISITPPQSTEPGGYFAAVFGSQNAPEANGKSNVRLGSDVGTLVLFRVNGTFTEGADILEFHTKNNKQFFDHIPVDFLYRFQNLGKDRARPLGDVIVKGWLQKPIIIPANPEGNNVLPQSIRKFEVTWPGSSNPKPGFWNAIAYEWHNFAIGKYTVTLNLVYGSNALRTTTAKTTIWLFPWQLLSVFALALLLYIRPKFLVKIPKRLFSRSKTN